MLCHFNFSSVFLYVIWVWEYCFDFNIQRIWKQLVAKDGSSQWFFLSLHVQADPPSTGGESFPSPLEMHYPWVTYVAQQKSVRSISEHLLAVFAFSLVRQLSAEQIWLVGTVGEIRGNRGTLRNWICGWSFLGSSSPASSPDEVSQPAVWVTPAFIEWSRGVT